MAKGRPPAQNPPLDRWDIYHAGNKARWIGTVEASDADAAIEEAVKTLGTRNPNLRRANSYERIQAAGHKA